jgi:CubicO group peptidase (beta-lactamase class C family)
MSNLCNSLRALPAVVAILCCQVSAFGQDISKLPTLDPRDLEAFFDGAMCTTMESRHIAGAVVAVVADNRLVFSKGYGHADVKTRRKVDPENSMFRIGSISKLFTWIAVMQLVEEGKLDLETDVNRYLRDVQVPTTYREPITLKHLLTHTPGFEDRLIGLFAHKHAQVGSLASVLRAQMPMRVRPPGVLGSYSNHGTALAGHVVACVSGLPWEDYVEQRIIKPLGLQHTLVRQPPEDELPPDLTKGYKREDGLYKEQGFEYVTAAPAGGISMSAADAARFMLAYLSDGQLEGARILNPETVRRMRAPLFRHDPRIDGSCYGFMEQNRDGLRILGHGGATNWFHSLMQMLPEQKVGFFVSWNTNTSSNSGAQVFDGFLKRYFPEPDPAPIVPAADAGERAKMLAGEYVITRHSHTSPMKLVALLSALTVSVNKDNTITISFAGDRRRYSEVEPLVYRELEGRRRVVFREDENGRGLYLFPADRPTLSAVRRPWYDTSLAHLGLLAVCIAVFASALVTWPAIAWSVRGLTSPGIRRGRLSGLLSCVAWLVSALAVALVGGLACAMTDATEIGFGLTPAFKASLALTPILAFLTFVTVLGSVVAWRQGYWRIAGRLHYTLVALAAIGFTWFLNNWNLLIGL